MRVRIEGLTQLAGNDRKAWITLFYTDVAENELDKFFTKTITRMALRGSCLICRLTMLRAYVGDARERYGEILHPPEIGFL